jgi:hypothetical protein
VRGCGERFRGERAGGRGGTFWVVVDVLVDLLIRLDDEAF